jgi:hypothetical protein
MYAAAGTFAGIYGLSKYLLNPMHESLSEARHEFFTHTGSKLDELNGRLSKVVTIPPEKTLAKGKEATVADDVSDISEASDPTELFHRDIGVQTSPSLSRKGSSASLSDTDVSNAKNALAKQESKLASITKSLTILRMLHESIVFEEQDASTQIDTFTKYLNDLMYSSPYQQYQGTFPTWGNTNASDDELDKFKNEIRSMKGAMLSTRNFPRGGS